MSVPPNSLPTVINPDNPVIRLVLAGTRAEFQGQALEARRCYRQAWDSARDDYEACIAAHYLARFQDSPQETLRWNQEALRRAEADGSERVREFYPSLYLSLGSAYEQLGEETEARRYYGLAADLGFEHTAE